MLLFRVEQVVRECAAYRWRLGRLVFDSHGGCLLDDGERIALSPMQVHLLRYLREAGAAYPARRLTIRQFAAELHLDNSPSVSQESSTRNVIAKLRQLLEDDIESPQVLRGDSHGYYIMLGPARTERCVGSVPES